MWTTLGCSLTVYCCYIPGLKGQGEGPRATNMNSCPTTLCSLCLKLLITDKIMGNDNKTEQKASHLHTQTHTLVHVYPCDDLFLNVYTDDIIGMCCWGERGGITRQYNVCVCVSVFIYLWWPAVFYHVMQQSTACQAYAGRTAINTQRKPLVSHRLAHERVRERGMGHPHPNLITLSVLRFCSCSLSLSFLLCLSTNNELKRKESYLRMYFGISIECKALYVCKKIGERERERELLGKAVHLYSTQINSHPTESPSMHQLFSLQFFTVFKRPVFRLKC